jgi:hypothetical protein
MKAEIKKDGYIWIIAETPTEAFALKKLTDDVEQPPQSIDHKPVPIVIDCSVLNPTMDDV